MNYKNSSKSYKFGLWISQVNCGSFAIEAPRGCTQLYLGRSGIVKSFNFEGNSYLARQNYRICLRAERDACFLKVTAEPSQFRMQVINLLKCDYALYEEGVIIDQTFCSKINFSVNLPLDGKWLTAVNSLFLCEYSSCISARAIGASSGGSETPPSPPAVGRRTAAWITS